MSEALTADTAASALLRLQSKIGVPRVVEELEIWWSQSQINYMRKRKHELDFYAEVIDGHDRLYHPLGDARAKGCCILGVGESGRSNA